jgi:hydrogenase maturation factor
MDSNDKSDDTHAYEQWLAEPNIRGSAVLAGETKPRYCNFVADGIFPLDPAGSVVILVHGAIQAF